MMNELHEARNALQHDILLLMRVAIATLQLPEGVRQSDVFHQQVPRIGDGPLSVWLIPARSEGTNSLPVVMVGPPGPVWLVTCIAAALSAWLYFKGYRRTAVLVKDERGNGVRFIITTAAGDVEFIRVAAHSLGSTPDVSN